MRAPPPLAVNSRYRRGMLASGPRARALVALAGLVVAGGVACGDPLPSSQRIASTRVLALRAEVVTPLFPEMDPTLAPRCEALPFEGVRLTPFVVDPEGPVDAAALEPVWIACNLGPIEGLFACLKAAIPTDLAAIPECPPVSLIGLDPNTTELPEPPSPCRLAADPTPADGQQDFTIPFASTLLYGGDVEITMIGRYGGAPSSTECADRLLAGATDLDDECVYVVQRVSVGPIERLLFLVSMFGVELPAGLELPDPAEIPDGDRNPRITDFKVTVVHPDGTTDDLGPQERGATIDVAIGDLLEIRTTAPEADLQTFPVQVNQGEGGTEDRQETYEARWFRTWGSLLAGSSDDPESYNEWEMIEGDQDEDPRPPGDRATLYYVLRDSRQGVDWWWINIAMAPADAP